jgi:hypothetical protein
MKPANEITKSHHEYVPSQPAVDTSKPTGYVDKEYTHQDYPKVLDFKDADGKDLTARDEKHEKELRDGKAKREAAAKAAEKK